MSIFNVDYYTIADYNSQNYYELCPVEKIYDTILIPIDNYPEFNTITTGSKINILYKNNKNQQSVIDEPQTTKLFNINYLIIKIAIGIRTDGMIPFIYDKYSISYRDKTYEMSLLFDKSNKCKLLIGSLILSDNYFFAFNENDTIQVFFDKDYELGTISKIENKHNYYLPLKYTTILSLDYSQNIPLLSFLNSYQGGETLQVRSLTTKPDMQRGCIRFKITNQDSGVYNYKIMCANKEIGYNELFYTNNILEINNLTAGTYFIRIIDDHGFEPHRINGELNKQSFFTINILGSIEEEKKILLEKYINNGIINPISIKELPPLRKLT
jgi:hypothetical protein